MSGSLIAHVLPYQAVGGTEIGTLRLLQVARELGYRNLVYCRPDADSTADLFARAGYPVQRFTPSYPGRLHWPHWLAHGLRWAFALRRQGVQLVHSADLAAASQVALAARLAGLPHLAHIRCLFDIGVIPPADLYPLRWVDHFAFVCRAAQQRFPQPWQSRGQVLYDAIAAAPSPGRELHRAEFGFTTEHFVFGMVARLGPPKDFDTLIDAAALCREQTHWRFLLIGDRESEPVYRETYQQILQRTAAAGLADRFVCTGHRSDVPALLSALDAFVLCSRSEGFPLSILEAQSAGLPVVASAVGGIPEAVLDGETGLLHAPADAPSLATALRRLAGEASLRQQLCEGAGRRLAAEFAPAVFRQQLQSLYGRMIRQ